MYLLAYFNLENMFTIHSRSFQCCFVKRKVSHNNVVLDKLIGRYTLYVLPNYIWIDIVKHKLFFAID